MTSRQENGLKSKEIIVISAINIIDGGALSVLNDCFGTLIDDGFAKRFHIIALVARKSLFTRFIGQFEFIEFPKSKSNWLYRLYYEYIYFNKWSKQFKIKYWLSMHDITPNVYASNRYVYCHNPSPFYKMPLKEARFSYKNYLFTKFYKYLYKINIRKNSAVIVQQDWIRDEFKKLYIIKDVIVARPSLPNIKNIEDKNKGENIFVFPSFPRVFKNFSIVCEASNILVSKGITNFKVYLTLDGQENSYSNDVFKKYSSNPCIVFCGLLEREKLFDLYAKSKCLLFMSKLETWGMPIMEYKATGKPMIVSDLPYAHETVGDYRGVEFVNPYDATVVASKMQEVIEKGMLNGYSKVAEIKEPYARNWSELCQMIFTQKE